MQVVANGWPELKKDCHPLPLDYWTYREEISAENYLLFKGHRLNRHTVIPEQLHNRVLHIIHEGNFSYDSRLLQLVSCDQESTLLHCEYYLLLAYHHLQSYSVDENTEH